MALNGEQLKALLERIDANLAAPGVICLIGSGATLLLGQQARQTDDLDVWARASRMVMANLEDAAEAAGVSFDPKDELPSVPYIQVVHPGIVQVPGWNPETRQWLGEPERTVWAGKMLTVTVPPPSIIAASKLLRGDDRDFEDCLWLMAAHAIDAEEISRAIKTLPREPRRRAAENLEMLSLLRPSRR